MNHITTGIRDRAPALNVKDDTVWAQHAEVAPLYDELGEGKIDVMYEQARERFWADAELLAQEAGYEIHSGGRSGGWLVVSAGHGHFLDYIVDDTPNGGAAEPFEIPPADNTADDDTRGEYAQAISARDRFMAFAAEIDQAMDQASDYFLDLLREAKAELDERRKTCIVRGEN